jgi:tetratricopeptide (TPR) repeat protein
MSRTVGTVLAVLLVASAVSAQEWRGQGRLGGKVVDEQGKALQNVVVQATLPHVVGAALQVKTDKRGEWFFDELAEATWSLAFQLQGYDPIKITSDADESGRFTQIKTTLKKSFDANGFIQSEVKKGDALLQQKKFAEARAVYDGIIAKVPQVEGNMQMYLARTYYYEGNPAKAAECLRVGVQKDPANTDMPVMLASMLAQAGQVGEAQKVAATIDETTLKTPDLYLDLGLGLLKDKKAGEALQFLDKGVAKFPQVADTYYYRASALIELVNAEKDPKNPVRVERMGKIKADLAKFLELAPTAPQADTVKRLLDQLGK